jgi:hypothetical protein
MAPSGDGKEERCKSAGLWPDLCGRKGLEYPLNVGRAVLMDEPAPVPQGSVVHELHDYRLCVFLWVKSLEALRPKKRAENCPAKERVSCGICFEDSLACAWRPGAVTVYGIHDSSQCCQNPESFQENDALTDPLPSRLYRSSNLIGYLWWKRWSGRGVFNGATPYLRTEPGDIFLPFDFENEVS